MSHRLLSGGTQVALFAMAILLATPACAAASEKTAPQAVDSSPTVTAVACEYFPPNVVDVVTTDSVVYFFVIVPVRYAEPDSQSPPTKVDAPPVFLHSATMQRDIRTRARSDAYPVTNMKKLSDKKLGYSSAKQSSTRRSNRRA
jgi:hypothetical protein